MINTVVFPLGLGGFSRISQCSSLWGLFEFEVDALLDLPELFVLVGIESSLNILRVFLWKIVLLVQKLARRKLLGEACDALRPGAYPCISLFSWEEVMASMEGMAVWTVVKSE